jgi:carbonic anhydrase/acetyltransferase-like protein (isoleucine patch superfamily)
MSRSGIVSVLQSTVSCVALLASCASDAGAQAPANHNAPVASPLAVSVPKPDHGPAAARPACLESSSPVEAHRPILPGTSGPGLASFVDPTVTIDTPERVTIRCRSFVAPFASLDASEGPIFLGDGSNIQDNVLITGRLVVLGDNVIVAHGATVRGPATVGTSKGRPAFVGFNAFVDGAVIEDDAMVGVLARVGPGVVIRSGKKVLPGKFVRTQGEADSASLGKVADVTSADRVFMDGVLHVNVAFARGYTDLFQSTPGQVRGIARDPGETDFNPAADLPVLGGKPGARPNFRARVIGKVAMVQSPDELAGILGARVSIRADEGEGFTFGRLVYVQDRVTFHALEHTTIRLGDGIRVGFHAVVHGGEDSGNTPHETTQLEDNVSVGDWSVVFRSTIGKGATIGVRALVDGSQLAAGTVVPDRAIIIDNKRVGTVEW